MRWLERPMLVAVFCAATALSLRGHRAVFCAATFLSANDRRASPSRREKRKEAT
jgi:hypothetical protein